MTFYHGTSDVFTITKLMPPQETQNLREEWRKKLLNKVFFTTSILSARKFAKKAAVKYGGNPIVYVVKPCGDVWHINTNEYVADYANIVGLQSA